MQLEWLRVTLHVTRCGQPEDLSIERWKVQRCVIGTEIVRAAICRVVRKPSVVGRSGDASQPTILIAAQRESLLIIPPCSLRFSP